MEERVRSVSGVMVALAALLMAGGAAPPEIGGFGMPVAVDGGDISLMTYNVRGLPWPLAAGRSSALMQIGDRLRQLRLRGTAPDVVVLEEAFTGQARSIGRIAGYAHVVDGSIAGRAVTGRVDAAETARLDEGARWWRGEAEGKWLGSGLQLLTDFPVIAVRRLSFGDAACAGYDCLADKGVLLVRLAVPGVASPVDVVATHMNSRGASGAVDYRSDLAHRLQSDMLTRFVADVRDSRAPLLVAGDFNVGKVSVRRQGLFGLVSARWASSGPVEDALEWANAARLPLSRDARSSMRRAKDLIYFAAGRDAVPRLVGVSVPFGRNAIGEMLSDHVGYTAHFRIQSARVRNDDRPKA